MIDTKKIIGLTGNIATGKSVIRRMLANTCALGIDADEVAHRMLYPGGPAYQPVIIAFGSKILQQDQHISRKKLGEIVFDDPQKLALLESFIHPGVITSILQRIHRSEDVIIVIEAIKLIESGLVDICDQLWVSDASPHTQVKRLMEERGLAKDEAYNRVSGQPPQSEKRQRADVVINTECTFKDTWQQVQSALNDTIQLKDDRSDQNFNIDEGWIAQPPNNVDILVLEDFCTDHSGMVPLHIYELLGKNMVLPILRDYQMKAMLGWENWNFTAHLTRILPSSFTREHPRIILKAFEAQSRRKQCEILLFSDDLGQELAMTYNEFNMKHQSVENLTYPAWQSAAQRLSDDQSKHVWAKILAQPIEDKGVFREIDKPSA